jgi:hypothetical protein
MRPLLLPAFCFKKFLVTTALSPGLMLNVSIRIALEVVACDGQFNGLI